MVFRQSYTSHGFLSKKMMTMVTVSLLKSTPFQSTVNTLHEIDVALPLPKSLYPPVLFHSRKEKIILFKQIEALIDMLGYNGKNCLQRLVCEVMFLRDEFVKNSLVLQVLVLVFKVSYEDSSKELKNKFLIKMEKLKKNNCLNKCKFSMFPAFLLKFD
uniref:Uncharacterized protein n=1 Tax=Rhodnius prolixus TaxID=13249 RepID=T1I1S1_RHOPR